MSSKASTEKLIIWIVGCSQELGIKLTLEELVLECWLINPEKHALRGYPQFPDSRTVLKRAGEMRGKKGFAYGFWRCLGYAGAVTSAVL